MTTTKINEKIEQYSLLKHPFYRAWSAGTLTREALCGYIKEYFHLVKAVPDMVEKIYRSHPTEEIKRNMEEERSHIALWEKFASGMGVSSEELYSYIPAAKTVSAVDKMLSLMENPVEGIAAMYAFEAEIPVISRTKLEGLKAFYGISAAETVQYFTEHQVADVYHTEVWKAMMENYSMREQLVALSSVTESLKAQNAVLDAVCDTYCSAMVC